VALVSTFNSQLSAVTFTNAITISETNLTYDGQDIIVDGATVTIDGQHNFDSLLLTYNAVLGHSPSRMATANFCDNRVGEF